MTETVPLRTRERFLQVALLGGGLTLLSGVTLLGPRAERGNAVAGTFLVLLPLVPLLWALVNLDARRRAASVGLLLLVPAALVFGLVEAPSRIDPIVFCVRAATLVGYLVQSSRLLASPVGPTPAVVVNALPALRERLLRRNRFYGVFVVLTVIAFVVPLQRALTAGGAALPSFAAAGLLAVLASRAFLVDPLDRHLQRDPALEEALARLRRHASRGLPNRAFYLVALVALVTMGLLVLRARLGWT
ncbi:MAG: hypothetical protein ABI321_24660 [Polyangia bacterium]